MYVLIKATVTDPCLTRNRDYSNIENPDVFWLNHNEVGYKTF